MPVASSPAGVVALLLRQAAGEAVGRADGLTLGVGAELDEQPGARPVPGQFLEIIEVHVLRLLFLDELLGEAARLMGRATGR